MNPPALAAMMQRVCRRFQEREQHAVPDARLLEIYLEDRDEAAFQAILRRHGPMVWGVCRRHLPHLHDAEDAYQATFLVLLRKAAAIRPRAKLGAWLHGVAFHVAQKAAAMSLRRAAREKPLAMNDMEMLPDQTADLRRMLDHELLALPEIYRTVLILCDLEGMTRREAAAQLNCPEGTVAGRLARAREMLAKRLARHGPLLSVPALLALLHTEAAALPPMVLSPTPAALTLAEGVMHTMTMPKGILVVAALIGVCLGVLGWGAGSPPVQARQAAPPKQAPRLDQEQIFFRQHVQGMRWYFEAYNPQKRTLKVTDTPMPFYGMEPASLTADPYGRLSLQRLPVAPDATVTLEGKPALWSEVKYGMQLRLRFAPGSFTVVAAEAERMHEHLIVKAVDAEKGTIAVALGSQGVLRELPVDGNAMILLQPPNKLIPLREVQAGMQATMKLCVETGRPVIVDLQVRP